MADWLGPPPLFRPVVLALDLDLGDAAGCRAFLPEVRAYPTGCELEVIAAVRLPGDLRPAAIWQAVAANRRGIPDTRGIIPTFIATLPEGTDASTDHDLPASAHRGALAPEPPILRLTRSWATDAGERLVTIRFLLWLWPLPASGSLRFGLHWPAFGLDADPITLDAHVITRAGHRSHPCDPEQG